MQEKQLNHPLVQLDIFAAESAKNAGMQKAVDNANKKIDGWSSKAYAFLITYLYQKDKKEVFMTEEIRAAAAKAGVPEPPSNRAWGGIMVKAAKENLIKRAGFAATKNVNAHCTPATVWKKI